MIYVILILSIVIMIIITYLLYLKYSIRKLNEDLKEYKVQDTNVLIKTNSTDRDINNLIMSINNELKYIKNKEILINNKNKKLKKMITNISHDLRTPLTSASGYVDILQTNKLNKEDTSKNLAIIDERLNKLSSLIDSFFEFSKLTSLDEKIEYNKLNIIQILEQSISLHYNDFSKCNRNIIFNTGVNKLEIYSNDILLSRIFDNLIQNSLKHSRGNLEINVVRSSELIIEFKNILLDEKLDTEKMFDEFYTKDISRNNGDTGLGLAIVKEFTMLLGGQVYAKKENNMIIIILKFSL